MRKAVPIAVIGVVVVSAVVVLALQPTTAPKPDTEAAKATALAAKEESDQKRFAGEMARIQSEGEELDRRNRAGEALLAEAERFRKEQMAAKWEAEQGAKDAALDAEQRAANDAAVKAYNQTVAEKQREARALTRARAEAERVAEEEALEQRKRDRREERAVAAAETQARAAWAGAEAAAEQARIAKEEAWSNSFARPSTAPRRTIGTALHIHRVNERPNSLCTGRRGISTRPRVSG